MIIFIIGNIHSESLKEMYQKASQSVPELLKPLLDYPSDSQKVFREVRNLYTTVVSDASITAIQAYQKGEFVTPDIDTENVYGNYQDWIQFVVQRHLIQKAITYSFNLETEDGRLGYEQHLLELFGDAFERLPDKSQCSIKDKKLFKANLVKMNKEMDHKVSWDYGSVQKHILYNRFSDSIFTKQNQNPPVFQWNNPKQIQP